ncbi:ABC transporter ATP-binding protein [Mesobacillus zeae]|uniref:ABC transporter ATP-binding protein n=1 Tax=Mesobacillus zeae TaxID=1917180 RepID=A0A398AZE7_9BACI|nr:ABC transporter ATP-binding protein [Mesobacillus zeae]RID83039.1 ABC transporter ATP-binding protein [Mesobacillus zeae]
MGFLTLNDIHHTYFTKTSATPALRNINIDIKEGEFVSFLGPSGCGKTTLLSIIAGLIQPARGCAMLDGKNTGKTDSGIGYMLQQDYLFPWKTIEENILIGPKINGTLNHAIKTETLALLDKMELRNVLTSYPKQLSGGMRQRVALVRTLATNPKLLLLDEPFSALDYQTKLKLENLVSSTFKTFNKTAILVTHDIGEAIAMSNRVLLFSQRPGKIHKIFDVPENLRLLSPFEARHHPAYNELFQVIWKELESLEPEE